jgi:hypothetical protein
MISDQVRKNCGQYLLRPPPPAQLDDVRLERRRDRLQPLGHGWGPKRAYVGHRGP